VAEFVVQGLDGILNSLQEFEALPDYVKDDILNAQADALIPEIQERGKAYGVEDTGTMLKKIKKGKVRHNKKGRYIVVAPRGTRIRVGKNGKATKITNAEIGFLQNYGTRHQKAKPFWSDTVEMSERTVTKAGEEVLDRYLKEKLNL
jgi:HK97 gp10 family phage protein